MTTPRFTQEQITKLACDAFAFTEAARLTNDHRNSIGAQPGSTAHYSLGTAIVVNVGLSLELYLKLIHYKLRTPVSEEGIHGHNLTALHSLLNPSIQSSLGALFQQTFANGPASPRGHYSTPT